MTAVLWTAIGISIGAVVLHTALGIRRPIDRTHLSFACIMASVAVFLYLQWDLYAATTAREAVNIKHRQVTILNLSLAGMFVFLPAYTRVHIPRAMTATYWTILVGLFIANLCAPYGLWFSGEPRLVASTFRGEPFTSVVAPAMAAPQLAYASFVISCIVVALCFAVAMFLRGDRQRAVTFAIALVLVLGHGITDVVRDNVGGTWPYVAEFGVVTWGLIMSVQLAHEFRKQTRSLATAIAQVEDQAIRLNAMLDALGALEQNMHEPLGKLEAGIPGLACGSPGDDSQLRRLERAVTRLREFARTMPDLSALRG
jgi:hypothetical protein